MSHSMDSSTSMQSMQRTHYVQLAVMTVLSFIAMYVLMYAMVYTVADAIPNINQLYMAGLMTAAMVMVELGIMRMMYRDRRINAAVVVASALVLLGCFLAIRQQTFVGDRAFIDSMIPHHSAAILMCREAAIEDGEIADLCRRITEGQQREIDQMRQIKKRLD